MDCVPNNYFDTNACTNFNQELVHEVKFLKNQVCTLNKQIVEMNSHIEVLTQITGLPHFDKDIFCISCLLNIYRCAI